MSATASPMNGRPRKASVILVLLCLPHFASAQTSPLLDYEAMQALKQRLARQVVEIEVTQKPQEGTDSTLVTTIVGQGVCLRTTILTSAFLLERARRIRIRTAAAPQWVEARVVREDKTLGIVFLAAVEEDAFKCRETGLAPAHMAGPGTVLFSVDNPVPADGQTTAANIFWGYAESFAEPPLARFLLTAGGLPLGGPLFAADGRLVALNLRRYTPTSAVFLAVTTAQLRTLLPPPREPEAPEGRHERRERDSTPSE